jgi:prohibitin 2
MAIKQTLSEAGRRLVAALGLLKSRLQGWYGRNSIEIRITVLVLLLAFTYLLSYVLVPIFPGQAGVIWRRFRGGTDTEYVLDEGLRFKSPWNEVFIYDIRLHTENEVFNVLTEDGLNMEVEITVRFRPNPKYLGLLHKTVGPDYIRNLIIPEMGAHARAEMAQLRPDQLHTGKRDEVQQRILERLSRALDVKYLPQAPGERLIYLQDVLIRNIRFPPVVAEAIQAKVVQKQKMEEYEYRLQKEHQEKERKRIEAEGIQLFQNIVTQGISEQFLKWKGINATLELAKSNNSKIVIIGAGKEGLPLILGNLETPRAATGSAPGRGVPNETEILQTQEAPEPEWFMDKP